jgi:hypothetical protein
MSAVVGVMTGPEMGAGPDGVRAMAKRTWRGVSTGVSSRKGRGSRGDLAGRLETPQTSGISPATIVRVEVFEVVWGERPSFDGSTPRARIVLLLPKQRPADLALTLCPNRDCPEATKCEEATMRQSRRRDDVLWLRSGRSRPFSIV